MEQITLNRQEQGKLAEQLVKGLHDTLPQVVQDTIKNHAQREYDGLIGDLSIRCDSTGINPYRWTDVSRVPIPEDVSWRPGLILHAGWCHRYRNQEIPNWSYWEQDTPPFSLTVPRRPSIGRPPNETIINCHYRVYYPVEVKSGEKKTLTSQQATAIPRIANEVDYVHPIFATVDTTELPESYSIDVEIFRSSDWNNNNSRYRSES